MSSIQLHHRAGDIDETDPVLEDDVHQWALCDNRGRMVVVTTPRDPSDPIVYLNADPIPLSPATTDPQASPIPVPKWARFAKVFAEYTIGAGGDINNQSGGLSVYMGHTIGSPLVNYNAAGIGSIGDGFPRFEVFDVGGAVTLGFAATDDGASNPGTMTITVVFY